MNIEVAMMEVLISIIEQIGVQLNQMIADHLYFTDIFLGIAQIGPLSFQTAIEHKPRQVRWGDCTLQWSLSGHQHVCISNSRETFKEATKENLKWKTFTT